MTTDDVKKLDEIDKLDFLYEMRDQNIFDT